MLLELTLKATYDTEADALYVYLPTDTGTKSSAVMQLSPTMLADVDDKGNVKGLEILGYTRLRKKKNDSRRTDKGVKSAP